MCICDFLQVSALEAGGRDLCTSSNLKVSKSGATLFCCHRRWPARDLGGNQQLTGNRQQATANQRPTTKQTVFFATFLFPPILLKMGTLCMVFSEILTPVAGDAVFLRGFLWDLDTRFRISGKPQIRLGFQQQIEKTEYTILGFQQLLFATKYVRIQGPVELLMNFKEMLDEKGAPTVRALSCVRNSFFGHRELSVNECQADIGSFC